MKTGVFSGKRAFGGYGYGGYKYGYGRYGYGKYGYGKSGHKRYTKPQTETPVEEPWNNYEDNAEQQEASFETWQPEEESVEIDGVKDFDTVIVTLK
mgnify:CR=1 FL=1